MPVDVWSLEGIRGHLASLEASANGPARIIRVSHEGSEVCTMFTLGPLGGAYADRLPKRRVIAICQLTTMMVFFTISWAIAGVSRVTGAPSVAAGAASI